MLKKISFAVVIGIVITIFFAQYDCWTHKKIVALLQKIAQESLNGDLICSVQSVSFFTPSLILYDVEMKSFKEGDWSWKCKKCEIACSWFQLFYKGVMDQYVVIEGFECNSRVQDFCFSIQPHIMAMMQKSFLPFAVELKSVVFKNARGSFFYDDRCNVLTSFLFNSSSLKIGNDIKTMMSVMDGTITCNEKNYIEKIAADVSITTQFINDIFDIKVHVAGSLMVPQMGKQGECYITGGWNSDRGRFSVRNAYNSLMIDPIIITEDELCVNTRFPLSYAVQCVANNLTDDVAGKVHCSAKINRHFPYKIDGHLIVEDSIINKRHIADVIKIIFGYEHDDWKVKLSANRSNQEFKGIGHWNVATEKGELIIKNVTDCMIKSLPYWCIKPNGFCVQALLDHDKIMGTYEAVITNTLSGGIHSSSGKFSLIHALLGMQGFIDKNNYSLEAEVYPQIALRHCMYQDEEDKKLIELQATENKKQVEGFVSFNFIRLLINNLFHYDVQGEGNLGVVASFSPDDIIADFALHEATIRLPQTYNFIDGFHARCIYNITNSIGVLENAFLSLYTGKMSCLRATAYWDDTGSLIFAHAPLIIDSCLFNIKKDLFAIISGNFLFSKGLLLPARVDGHIIIDKAQLKENLFSGIIQKQLLSYTNSAVSPFNIPLQGNFTIETKLPIIVDTGFLQTNAQVNLRLKKDSDDPIMTGVIALHAGTLNFPYKPLYISKGMITFSPEELCNPSIELFARNKIKKYDVFLQIDGSLLNHQISLDANPQLSEEQIVGLLLVGAEENSLNSMMPALIVQNLKNFIFSNNQSHFFDKYFKPLLGSLNINLVPSFTDQTGRGGLRGALEITLDDRWRAVIQKNFSLTEDTKFELEFLLSDDITLRAIRDERRDLGGEVEMRWKF